MALSGWAAVCNNHWKCSDSSPCSNNCRIGKHGCSADGKGVAADRLLSGAVPSSVTDEGACAWTCAVHKQASNGSTPARPRGAIREMGIKWQPNSGNRDVVMVRRLSKCQAAWPISTFPNRPDTFRLVPVMLARFEPDRSANTDGLPATEQRIHSHH